MNGADQPTFATVADFKKFVESGSPPIAPKPAHQVQPVISPPPALPGEPKPSLLRQQYPQFPGEVALGNIDLDRRPVVHNEDGQISTEYSFTFPDNGKWVNVPSVVNGRFLTPDGKRPPKGSQAEKDMGARAFQYYKHTGQHLGIYDTRPNAEYAAEHIHERQDRVYHGMRPPSPP